MADKETPAAPAAEKGDAAAAKPGEAAAAGAAAAGGGGMSAGAFMGLAGGFLVISMGLGLGFAYLVVPKLVKKPEAPKTEAHSGEEKSGEGHGEEKKAEGGEEKKAEGHGEEKKAAEGHGEEKKAAEGHGEKKAAEGHSGGDSSKPAVKEFMLNDVSVNVAGTRGGRYMKVSLSFDAVDAVIQELESKRPMIIDLVSEILGSKPMEEVTAPTARGVLRAQMLNAINPTLKKGQVKNIYFLEFVIQ